MDPDEVSARAKFEFEARAAMLTENMQTVVNFMQRIVEEMPKKQAQMERMQHGDIFAFANWLKDFERESVLFAELAQVIRKHEHA
ncbi:hypothetical protein HWB99_gp108 [Mycobacterium phage DrLupo]|uniref:Uncharacterized protein n=1 Tax=Mycobacterium phage DrLupo TaxID=2499037 RepID=A0A3S9UQS5_9CAUD|nr:hypothetical protein HWB99_gp108 [Mycobacterium phage DrLupo]AZS12644.1 hypothetical protein SEA_DRLUPO_108 [Mycobacterium phage DrLupo]